jgi:hypothetical protein
MAVAPGTEYTLEELYDNYEFKVVKRAIMKEFPWIKEVSVTQENLDTYSSIFLDFEIDLPQLLQTYDWPIYIGAEYALRKDRFFHSMYLTLMAGVTYEETKVVTNQIDRLMKLVHDSPALPKDLKLKEGRRFTTGDFYFNKGKPEW